MDNLFYADHLTRADKEIVISGSEANHISRVLRFKSGDTIYLANGKGCIFEAIILSADRKKVAAELVNLDFRELPEIQKVLAFGAIKKRDRLEYAVEKAVELDASEICIFHADHSERSRINDSRLEAIIESAFKQSKRYWKPDCIILDSLNDVFINYKDHQPVIAHVPENAVTFDRNLKSSSLLIVGPEGGFSKREVDLARDHNSEFISLGRNRLRAETAVAAMLSQYLFSP